MVNDTGLVAAVPAGQDYTVYIIGCLVILLIIGGFIIFRRVRKNRVPKEIPEEVLKEFNRAEELSVKYKGEVTPQAILWQVNEERKKLFTLKDGEYDDKIQVALSNETPKPINKPKLKFNFKWK